MSSKKRYVSDRTEKRLYAFKTLLKIHNVPLASRARPKNAFSQIWCLCIKTPTTMYQCLLQTTLKKILSRPSCLQRQNKLKNPQNQILCLCSESSLSVPMFDLHHSTKVSTPQSNFLFSAAQPQSDTKDLWDQVQYLRPKTNRPQPHVWTKPLL